jgi:SAM-dependent methyltransferase
MGGADRLANERDFHNARFAGGDNRSAQEKYYWAINRGAEAYDSAVRRFAAGNNVLEYGCANGEVSLQIAPLAKHVEAIDISDVAIETAKVLRAASNVRYHVMDAMNLSFADASGNLVFGSGIIHHLDIRQASREIARVLRPGGRAVFWEPMGTNPAIGLYRKLTPTVRTIDEHPLVGAHIKIMEESFSSVALEHFGLTTLLALPFRTLRVGQSVRAVFEAIDSVLLAVPGPRSLAWYALIVCAK